MREEEKARRVWKAIKGLTIVLIVLVALLAGMMILGRKKASGWDSVSANHIFSLIERGVEIEEKVLAEQREDRAEFVSGQMGVQTGSVSGPMGVQTEPVSGSMGVQTEQSATKIKTRGAHMHGVSMNGMPDGTKIMSTSGAGTSIAGDILQDSYEGTSLTIDRRHAGVNQPFQAVNMFPGDRISQKYVVDVTHRGTIVLHFQAKAREDAAYAKLAEELMVEIKVNGTTGYQGLIRDMSAPLSCAVTSADRGKTITSVQYEIMVSLDTSAGNEYQNKELVADFNWWAEVKESDAGEDGDDGNDGDSGNRGDGSGGMIITPGGGPGGNDNGVIIVPGKPDGDWTGAGGELAYIPKTGDTIGLSLACFAGFGLLFVLFWMLGKRRREEEHES